MMIKSSKPRKQREYRHNAPLHQMQHMAHAHISKELRQKLKVSKRSIQVSKGDSVKLVSGGKKGTTGKVTSVDLKHGKLFIDSLNRKDAKGKEKPIPISISNVYITDLNLGDKRRAKKLKVTAPTTSQKPSVGAKEVIENGEQRQQ
ncbi:MAG: 50S ribosomal protein L24 [Candidatus Marsarchaeota archaeon]|nr:50S ribosomal protein L24 [Candidatus Marsarchaeota archaeon]